MIATLFLIVSLVAAYRAVEHPSLARFGLLGVANGMAVLGHQTNVLFAGAALAALLLAGRGAPDARPLRLAAAYAAGAIAVVVPAYAAAVLAHGLDTPREVHKWLTLYVQEDAGGQVAASAVPKALIDASRAVIGGHFTF